MKYLSYLNVLNNGVISELEIRRGLSRDSPPPCYYSIAMKRIIIRGIMHTFRVIQYKRNNDESMLIYLA